MATAKQFAAAAQAMDGKGISYDTLDCQGFVEQALRDVGVRRNWRGSNHMWRDALAWKGTVEECLKKYGAIPTGAWLFTIKRDGKEPATYTDGINAAHVGVYTGVGLGSMHSSTGGVQQARFPDSSRWTHVGIAKDLDYELEPKKVVSSALREGLEQIHTIVEELLHGIA